MSQFHFHDFAGWRPPAPLAIEPGGIRAQIDEATTLVVEWIYCGIARDGSMSCLMFQYRLGNGDLRTAEVVQSPHRSDRFSIYINERLAVAYEYEEGGAGRLYLEPVGRFRLPEGMAQA